MKSKIYKVLRVSKQTFMCVFHILLQFCSQIKKKKTWTYTVCYKIVKALERSQIPPGQTTVHCRLR